MVAARRVGIVRVMVVRAPVVITAMLAQLQRGAHRILNAERSARARELGSQRDHQREQGCEGAGAHSEDSMLRYRRRVNRLRGWIVG